MRAEQLWPHSSGLSTFRTSNFVPALWAKRAAGQAKKNLHKHHSLGATTEGKEKAGLLAIKMPSCHWPGSNARSPKPCQWEAEQEEKLSFCPWATVRPELAWHLIFSCLHVQYVQLYKACISINGWVQIYIYIHRFFFGNYQSGFSQIESDFQLLILLRKCNCSLIWERAIKNDHFWVSPPLLSNTGFWPHT